MKKTEVTMTCDRCLKQFDEAQWNKEFSRFSKNLVFSPVQLKRDGDYCGPCTHEYDKLLKEALEKWSLKEDTSR